MRRTQIEKLFLHMLGYTSQRKFNKHSGKIAPEGV